MCSEHYHICKYCSEQYDCVLPTRSCPTVNFDADRNLCGDCRIKLEELINEFTFEDSLDLLKEQNGKK